MAKILVVEAYEGAFRNFRRDFLDTLVSAGHNVIAAAPEVTPAMRAELRARHILFAQFAMNRASINPLQNMETIRSLKHLIAQSQPDKIVAFGPKTVIHTGIAARIARANATLGVITGRGYGLSSKGVRGRLVAASQVILYRIALPGYESIYFHNPDDQSLFTTLGLLKRVPRAGTVGGSGVDLTEYTPTPMPNDRAIFLFVGRLIASKGIREFIAAAELVKEKCPDATFKVAGWYDHGRSDGFTEDDFEALKASSQIEYLGNLHDVRPALSSANVLVLPSYGEGTPRSVLEALAMKRAVITTNTPGCRNTVLPETSGYIVPARDHLALAEAMQNYAQEPELATVHGESGHTLAQTDYAVNVVNSALFEAMAVTCRHSEEHKQ